MTIDVGVKINALFFNLPQSRQGKHLKSAGIREDRAIPVHKFVQTAKLSDQLVAGTDMEVVGIGKFHLRADRAEIIGRNRALDRRHRADIHENRRLDGSVDRFHFRAFCAAIFV